MPIRADWRAIARRSNRQVLIAMLASPLGSTRGGFSLSSETTPPFRFWRFFFSPQGRVSRKAVWYFLLPVHSALLAAQYGIGLTMRYLLTPNEILYSGWLYANLWVGLAMVILLWPSFAIMVKRLHDCGMAGMFAIPILIPLILAITIGIISAHFASQGNTDAALRWENAIGYARSIIELYVLILIIFLALQRSSPGPNRFGDDPSGYAPHAVF